MACSALVMRFRKTCVNWLASPSTSGQIGLGHEVHGDAIGAQRVLVKLQAALNEIAQMHADLVRLRRPRERQQVLHDLSGAARLAVSEVELPARDIVGGGIAAAVR